MRISQQMNLSEEYVELITRLLAQGQKYGVSLNPIDSLNAARYGPEIKAEEIELITTAEQLAMQSK